ncbi:MAG TPA: hypothetical protein DEH24_16085 [Alteromonas sp.]|nr:hypothetical protein [Alteromonadaceae bacterium]HBY40945.1 hypothetical protein [Alteromonas sp.]
MKLLLRSLLFMTLLPLEFALADDEASGNVITYPSRCGIPERTKEENLASSVEKRLVSTGAPRYPAKAARDGIEGYAVLEYDLSAEGKPVNINVIEVSPSDIFVVTSVQALSKWQYTPGKSTCHVVRLDYQFE